MLIAYKSYGQSDSVTISLQKANLIEQRLRSCELKKIQYNRLLEAEKQQGKKIAALHSQVLEQISKYNLASNRLSKLEAKYIREEKRKKLWRALVPIAFFGGVLTPFIL